MNLIQLLQMENFDFSKKCKIVRHTREGEVNIEQIYKNGQLMDYQSVQTDSIFDNCTYILSFIADEGTKAKFVGAYEIASKTILGEIRKTKELPDLGVSDFYKDEKDYYIQKEVPILSDLKDRLIIDWGKSTRTWCQVLNKKEIVEILPNGYVNNFPGFDDVVISFDELKKIIDYKDANREWHKMLASVSGVYLILDTEEGKQYVGSASGKEGILGRWKQYAQNGHGDNRELMKVLENNASHCRKFQFSILRTLPRTLTQNEVIAIETVYKKKLGSRAFGLNSN